MTNTATLPETSTAIWNIDPTHSIAEFKVKHMMIANVKGQFSKVSLDISIFQATVQPTSKVLVAARNTGIPIVYLKMGFSPDLSDLGTVDCPNRTRHLRFGVGQRLSAPDGTEGRMLIRDTWNTDVVPELEPESGDIVIYKNRFSGFFETELDDVLRRGGTKYLIVTGCTTSV